MTSKKQFKEFDVVLKIDTENGGKRLLMVVETNPNYSGKYQFASLCVNPPNFIDRLRGITWQDKIAAIEKKLFKQVLATIKVAENCELQNEIDKWHG